MTKSTLTYQEICEIIDFEVIENLKMGTGISKCDGIILSLGALETTQRAMGLLCLKYKLAMKYYDFSEKFENKNFDT